MIIIRQTKAQCRRPVRPGRMYGPDVRVCIFAPVRTAGVSHSPGGVDKNEVKYVFSTKQSCYVPKTIQINLGI